MMEHVPTEEQQAILDAAKQSSDNLIIHALAGAAKTSTLVLIGKALPSVPTLCLAFNKKIALEMKERLPSNCESMTLNSIGHRTWMQAIGKRLVVNPKKTYEIVKEIVESLKGEDKNIAYDMFSEIIKAVDQGKTAGYIPTGRFPTGKALLGDEEFFTTLEDEPSALMEHIIKKASYESIARGMKGEIDFNDQILLPTVFHGKFPAYPLTLGDEVQDWSELNHMMIRKIVRKNRFMGVGDENQSIYAFRGAHQNSMELLREEFECRRFDLSISFRCPKSVVREARSRAPGMMWPEWAKDGEVIHLPKWSADALPQDCTILCRNNSPLFGAAVKLLKNGKFPTLQGNDIGRKLVKIMGKLGAPSTPQEDAYKLVDEWVQKKLKSSRAPDSVHDQAACMKIFIDEGATLNQACLYAEHLMTISGNIQMMTAHKSKGLEWNTVYLLDRELMRTDKSTQERNLLYVAQTRAKDTLAYIRSDGFEGV